MSDLLEAIASLLWPLVIGAVLLCLFPVVRNLLRESESVNVEVGGTKVSIQRASDDLKALISDLQDRVNQLENPQGVARTNGAASPVVTPLARKMLWVDDRLEANVYERARLDEAGVRVLQAESTERALQVLRDSGPFDVIVSDMGRVEERGHMNKRAGLDLLERLRAASDLTPVVFYSSHRGIRAVADELQRYPDARYTTSPSELMGLLGVSGTNHGA